MTDPETLAYAIRRIDPSIEPHIAKWKIAVPFLATPRGPVAAAHLALARRALRRVEDWSRANPRFSRRSGRRKQRVIALCDECVGCIGGACAGPDAEWRPARPGEPCEAYDCLKKETQELERTEKKSPRSNPGEIAALSWPATTTQIKERSKKAFLAYAKKEQGGIDVMCHTPWGAKPGTLRDLPRGTYAVYGGTENPDRSPAKWYATAVVSDAGVRLT